MPRMLTLLRFERTFVLRFAHSYSGLYTHLYSPFIHFNLTLTQALTLYSVHSSSPMAITFQVATHKAETVSTRGLSESCDESGDDAAGKEEVIATAATASKDATYVRMKNGFVDAVTWAYNQHHHLVVRPDDVWMAIMVQFSLYVNANAEKLRTTFVSFDGKKELIVHAPGRLWSADYAALAHDMSFQIAQNINDPSVREWVMPGCSTTTIHDKVVGAIVLMAAMQAYFDFAFCLTCGLPSVTLEGIAEDWRALETRARRLTDFDTGDGLMKQWSELLLPVLRQFTVSAEGTPDVAGFWSRVSGRALSG
ncbi:unnamed protein product, partial [Phaeothamnion confervicola]